MLPVCTCTYSFDFPTKFQKCRIHRHSAIERRQGTVRRPLVFNYGSLQSPAVNVRTNTSQPDGSGSTERADAIRRRTFLRPCLYIPWLRYNQRYPLSRLLTLYIWRNVKKSVDLINFEFHCKRDYRTLHEIRRSKWSNIRRSLNTQIRSHMQYWRELEFWIVDFIVARISSELKSSVHVSSNTNIKCRNVNYTLQGRIYAY